MIKILITDAVVSRGYDGAPAIRFFEGQGSPPFASFRIGKRVYDSRADNKYRWINLTVKAFGDLCERIKKMKLKEGSYITLLGRYDVDTWIDKTTNEERSDPIVILDDIEYSYSGNGQKAQGGGKSDGKPAPAPATGAAGAPPAYGNPSGFGMQGDPTNGYGAMPAVGAAAPMSTPPANPGEMPDGFTGFENFSGSGNPFFPEM